MSAEGGFSATSDQWFGIILLGAAAGMLCYDSFLWLQSGEFHSLTIRELLVMMDSKGTKVWLVSPDRWIGVWKMINWTPVSLVLFLFGYNIAKGNWK